MIQRHGRRSGFRSVLCFILLLGIVSCTPQPLSDGDRSRTEDARESDAPRRTFHVQIRTVGEKSAADRAVSDAVAWFDGLPEAERPEPLSAVRDLPVDVRWKAPFYRVRVGPFSSREAASAVLRALKSDFPEAFIARQVAASAS